MLLQIMLSARLPQKICVTVFGHMAAADGDVFAYQGEAGQVCLCLCVRCSRSRLTKEGNLSIEE